MWVCLELHENILSMSFASQKPPPTPSPKSLQTHLSEKDANKCSWLFLCALNRLFVHGPSIHAFILHPSIHLLLKAKPLPLCPSSRCRSPLKPSGDAKGSEVWFWPQPLHALSPEAKAPPALLFVSNLLLQILPSLALPCTSGHFSYDLERWGPAGPSASSRAPPSPWQAPS